MDCAEFPKELILKKKKKKKKIPHGASESEQGTQPLKHSVMVSLFSLVYSNARGDDCHETPEWVADGYRMKDREWIRSLTQAWEGFLAFMLPQGQVLNLRRTELKKREEREGGVQQLQSARKDETGPFLRA